MMDRSPSAPDSEAVGAVFAGLYDDEALAGEADLEGLAAAPPDQGGGLEAALGLGLQPARPRDQRVRVDVGLVLAAAAVDDDRGAARGDGHPAGTRDADVEQALSGELGQPLDPLDAPLQMRVEGEQIGAVDRQGL